MGSRDVITADLARTAAAWDPTRRPVHCSNCLHAKVGGTGSVPQVWCAQGHGRARTIWQLWRMQAPSGFRAAQACPDFTRMDDDA